MHRSRQGHASALHLLDVLEQLPLDVLQQNIWSQLPLITRRSLRLASQQSRKLSNLIITSASRSLHFIIPIASAWERAADYESRCALLSDLTRLTSLGLTRWPDQPDLVVCIRLCANSSPRITHLTLLAPPPEHPHDAAPRLSSSITAASQQAWPQLQHLTVGSAGHDSLGRVHLIGPLFCPLHGAALTQLDLQQGAVISAPALASLAGLTGLQHLCLCLHRPGGVLPDLRPLSSLAGLRHCEVCEEAPAGGGLGVYGRLSLQQYLPLLTSTHLTTLRLRHACHVSPIGSDPADPATAALCAQLCRLHDLQALELDDTFSGTSAFSDALTRLSRLTLLRLGVLLHDLPTSRHLPLLQHLHLSTSYPLHLLHTLTPLLPLPALTALNVGSLSLGVGIGQSDADGPAAQANALTHVAHHLAAAPRLQVGPKLHVRASSAASHQLSMGEVADSLRPLAAGVVHLCLHHLRLPLTSWAAVHAALPALRQLTLEKCDAGPADLAALAHGLVALRRLNLHHVGPGGMGEPEWLALVAGRAGSPLQLLVQPPVTAGVIEACHAAQQRRHGGQYITWL